MSKIIVLYNMKGGVGKSTLTCLLSSYLNYDLSKEVVVLDADTGQHSLNVWRDQDVKNYDQSIETIENGSISVDQIRHHPDKALIPHMMRVNYNQQQDIGESYPIVNSSLSNLLEHDLSEYPNEYSIIDLGGRLEQYQEIVNLLTLADYLIVPTSTTDTDRRHTFDFLNLIRRVLQKMPVEQHPTIRMVWFKWQPMYQKATDEFEKFFTDTFMKGLDSFAFLKGKVQFAEVGFNERKLRTTLSSPFAALDQNELSGPYAPAYVQATRVLLEEIVVELQNL